MAETKKSVFETLNKINVNDHTESKNGLTYLSWAWAWAEVKKAYPDAFYTIYENADGWNYHTDGKTAWVKTGVTIEGIEMIEYLPVMDYKNKSIPLESITSFNVNTAIQRSLTKACARHGLGLYIYAGEDLPEAEPKEDPKEIAKRKLGGKKLEIPTDTAFTEILQGKHATAEQIDAIRLHAEKINQPIERICESYTVKRIEDLTPSQADEVIEKLKGAKK